MSGFIEGASSEQPVDVTVSSHVEGVIHAFRVVIAAPSKPKADTS
jgi:hypothetical protein